MFIPKLFAEPDVATCHALIRDYGFGVLVTAIDDAPFATHLPFLIEESGGANGTLIAHMARANPHWQAFAQGGESLAIFQGPHAYISPAWYETKSGVVPTWNYAAVHAYGVPQIVEDEKAARACLERLVARHEDASATPWRIDSQPEDFIAQMAKGIVAFTVPIARLEGKWKMSQNRPEADRAGVIGALENAGVPLGIEVAHVMRTKAKP